jgi:transposase
MAGKNLSQLSQFVDSENSSLPVFIGIDVHKNSYHVALRRTDGLCATLVSKADPGSVIATIRHLKLNVALAAYEAGPTGFGLARDLSASAIPALVAAPSRIPRQPAPGAKTDRLDCVKLAEYAAKGLLKPIAIPSPEQEAERCLSRHRSDLVESLRQTKQRIKSLLLQLHIEEPNGLRNWTRASVAALDLLALPGEAKTRLESLVRTLGFFQAEIALVETQLGEIGRKRGHEEAIERLRRVPGVGLVVATAFRLEVFSPERFASAGQLTSYLGLAPQVRQSGEGKSRGRLRPVGQQRLRNLLIEAAWTWKAKDPAAEQCYRRILGRCGVFQKAIVAVARRLAVVLWRLCLEDRPYYLGVAA